MVEKAEETRPGSPPSKPCTPGFLAIIVIAGSLVYVIPVAVLMVLGIGERHILLLLFFLLVISGCSWFPKLVLKLCPEFPHLDDADRKAQK